MKRSKAREEMMSILFQMEGQGDFDVDNKAHYFHGKKFGNHTEYCEKVYSLACNKKEEIDKAISDNSNKWKINRIPKTDLAILRLATIEILYMEEIPEAVSINEAVELSKVYCDDNAGSYINGILGSIGKNK